MTIATLFLAATSPSRWGEFSRLRAAEANDAKPRTADRPAKAEAEREGPRRSPLFGAIKEALQELAAAAPSATEATDSTASAETPEGADNGEALEQALVEFARALMHALREGHGPHGEGRGRHLGHAHGHGHQAWGDAAQRLERLAREVAPSAAAEPVEAAADAAPVQPTKMAAEAAETTETTGTAEAAPSNQAPAAGTAPATSAPALVVRMTLELQATQSPWKAVHDGLIESFAEVQRAIGRPDTDGDQSLEERLREMLVALAAKLRSNAINTAALAPAGSLLSVVA